MSVNFDNKLKLKSIALEVMIKSYWFIFGGRVESKSAEVHRVCNYQYLHVSFLKNQV